MKPELKRWYSFWQRCPPRKPPTWSAPQHRIEPWRVGRRVSPCLLAMQNGAPLWWPWEPRFGSRVAAWLNSSAPGDEPDLLAVSAGLTGEARQRGVAFVRLLVAARRDDSHPWHRLLQADIQRLGAVAQAYDVLCDQHACPALASAGGGAAGAEAASGTTEPCPDDARSLERFELVVARTENLSAWGFSAVVGMSKHCFASLLRQLAPRMGVVAGSAEGAEVASTHLKVVLIFMRNGERSQPLRGFLDDVASAVLASRGLLAQDRSHAPSHAPQAWQALPARRWQTGVHGARGVARHAYVMGKH